MISELADRAVWSRSQVGALAECPRKFALNLKSARDAQIDPVYTRAAKLKKMKNRHLWAASLVHDAVGSLLKSLRQGSPLPEAEPFINDLKTKMRDEFKASRGGANEVQRLFEHEHNIAVAPDVWRGHWNTVESSVRWFYQSKWLTRLSTLGPECWKAVDELLEFDVAGIKSYAKIDCAVESDGKFFLIDWKTSNPTADAEPSLLVSALYAHEVWGAEPDQINALAVSLVSGQTFHADVNEDSLMNTHLRIEEESAALEQAKAKFSADPFTAEKISDINKCRRCSYQKLCYPEGVR